MSGKWRTAIRPLSRSDPARYDAAGSEDLGAAIAAETPILLAAARLIVGSDSEAWDVVQTTIEIALRHGTQLRQRQALRAWLLVIQSREAFRLRRRVRRGMSLDSDEAQLPSIPGPNLVRLVVRDALAQLPPRIRTAVVLHHMVGLTIEQVAEAMRTSENTVKGQVRIGTARLREILRDE